MKPTNIFKNFTITPFFKILRTLVLSKVPGVTYCSNYILLIYYYSIPLKLRPLCSSDVNWTLIRSFVWSISVIVTIIWVFSVRDSKISSSFYDLGRKNLYYLHLYTNKWHPSSSFDLISAGNTCPILKNLGSSSINLERDNCRWLWLILLTTEQITKSPGYWYD